MINEVTFYYGPKAGFMRLLPDGTPITTISELAIYSDKKMREHTFKIQTRRENEQTEKPAERLCVPCLVAFSEQYASISESAVNSFLSFISQFDVQSIFLQNPPQHIAAQFESLHIDIKRITYNYRHIDFESLRRINREYDSVIVGQPEVRRRLLRALYPIAADQRSKPSVILFYGPTGVGKSETAKYISDVTCQKLFRKQFSMFHSNEFASYLFGGRHTADCLAKDLMERESNIILFDEFDKPNPLFHSAFYQIFDEGIYEDRNYAADVRGSLIICTSNYASPDDAREKLGAPIFARFDAVIGFSALSVGHMTVILKKEIDKAYESLNEAQQNIINKETLFLSLSGHVCEDGCGARGIQHMVRDKISDILLDHILSEK